MKITIVCPEESAELVKQCIDIYMGDYAPTQQYAASVLLRMTLKNKQYYQVMDAIREETGFKVNDRQSAKVVRWAKKVKKAGKCEICGATENLHAHHIGPWEYSISGRLDEKNGQCLCKNCHNMMHQGELWVEYMMERYGRRV